MVRRLMHNNQLETLYKSYGSSNSAGVIWGHWGQEVSFTKMLFLLQIILYNHGTHAYSSATYLLQKLWV